MDNGEETPISAVRLYRMGIPPNRASNMNESLYLIIGYLLRDDYRELEVVVSRLVGQDATFK